MLYAPHPKQESVHKSKARYKVLNWGRRTGKSTLAVNYIVWEALKKYESYVKEGKQIRSPFNYFIIAPTYRQAKTIFWNDIVKTQIPREIVAKTDETELSLNIPHHNTDFGEPNVHPNAEDLPAITISLKGAENEDSLRGVKLSGVVLDEYAYIKPLVWDKIIRPALSDERGWAIFISTPNGFNHFFELKEHAEQSKNWFYSHATIYDNPYIPVEEIAEIKHDELKKDPDGNTWFQEYLADFRQMTGLVFKQFDRKKHLIEPDNIPEEGTNLIGVDFGWENPTACVFARIDHDNNWYIYDLIYQNHLTTDEIIQRLRDKMTGQYFTAVVGDSAQAQEIANMKAKNFPIKAVQKRGSGKIDSVQLGVRLISDKLKPQPTVIGELKPKLFIRKDLLPLIHEFEKYRYPQDTEGSMVNKDRPVDENNHAIDALRYLMMTHTEHREPIVRRQKRFDRVTGRVLS